MSDLFANPLEEMIEFQDLKTDFKLKGDQL